MSRLAILDSVRGAAIVAVVAVHTTGAVVPVVEAAGGAFYETLLGSAAAYGRFGVYLFFVLSGWLIFSLYDRDSAFDGKAYWVRRLARIWPLWLVFLALSLFLRGVLDPTGSGPFSWLVIGSWPLFAQFVLGAFFLGWLYAPLASTPPGGWSIQAEMGHYLLFPLIRRHGARLLVATVIVGQLSYFVARGVVGLIPGSIPAAIGQGWMQMGLYGTWPYFVAGGVLALAWQARSQGMLSARVQAMMADRILVGLLLTALLLAFATPVLMGTNAEAVGSVVILTAIAIAMNSIKYVSGALQSLGRTSYFIYFAHFFVLAAIGWVLSRSALAILASPYVAWPVVFVLGLTISWALAQVSWRVFENPIIRAARRVR